jgi:hypothetical protein
VHEEKGRERKRAWIWFNHGGIIIEKDEASWSIFGNGN